MLKCRGGTSETSLESAISRTLVFAVSLTAKLLVHLKFLVSPVPREKPVPLTASQVVVKLSDCPPLPK